MQAGTLDTTISFRAGRELVDDIETYRRARRLAKRSVAARELITTATELVKNASGQQALEAQAMAELRRMGIDPLDVLQRAVICAH